jgi:DNA-binding Lrp family transcriptional regulator
MGRHKVDLVDLKILAELQSNGRMTNVELAEKANITAPPSLRRVRALEKAGFIRGYHADLDPKSLGFELTAFAFVGLSSQAEADLRAFEEQIRAWPLVRECYMLSGEVDFVLKCVAHDLSEFQAFVTEQLTAVKNVASVKTALSIRTSKREPGVPIDRYMKHRQTIDAG